MLWYMNLVTIKLTAYTTFSTYLGLTSAVYSAEWTGSSSNRTVELHRQAFQLNMHAHSCSGFDMLSFWLNTPWLLLW